MRRQVDYQWRVRELMARSGMRNSRDLVEPLRERGITLSESQIYRLVAQEPERIAFKVLVALADIFRVEVNELVTYSATDTRALRPKKAVGSASEVPLAEAYRPIRARIKRPGNDDE
ncbi:helix-turn-helix domain-containing protein [Paeniglutamicibacter kerguelensis]|uniref:DNA-binding Xre family transcriptional regulator n=1 Tax=Paeniglutamicibacter kerguelensis TaxID=254788 RepID=A0ABS4XC67_9MICC|nr:helix-turn-helix transcriptional regulator [Paeniglutamicibacter kerguelensis]MBP2385951.1 DNA-binding Xre family transcriptional regulator [Paeniglutamicibacter kerguelensis]